MKLIPLRSIYSPHTLFSNTFSLCYSFDARSQVSHPYKTKGIIIVLYVLIFTLLDRREDRSSELNGSKHYSDLIWP
jgi:hypothetical protein